MASAPRSADEVADAAVPSSAEPLDAEAFPAFSPLLIACQPYAELSGCRFQRGAFQNLDREMAVAMDGGDNLPPLLAAKMRAGPVVEDFRARARQPEPELTEAVHRAYGLVMSEGVRCGIVATCRELGLWPPQPSAKGVQDDDCSFQDTTASLPVIAQRAYNDEARRQVDGVLQPLARKTVTASFIADFAVDSGMVTPSLSDANQDMMREFMDRVDEWTRQQGAAPAVAAAQRARQAFLSGLGFGEAADEMRQGLQAQWSKNWETRVGTAVNVAVAGLAIAASLASMHKAGRRR